MNDLTKQRELFDANRPNTLNDEQIKDYLFEKNNRRSGKAIDRQVAGDHYKGVKYQHVEFAAHNRLGYLEGQITKYITRYRRKNGVQDLEKALHFTDFLYEFLCSGDYTVNLRDKQKMVSFTEFVVANSLGTIEARIVSAIVNHDGVSNRLHEVRGLIKQLMLDYVEELKLKGN